MFTARLFGPPVIEGEEGPLNGRAAQRHRLGLLALLSAAPGHQLSRDKLLAYLWPDADAERARHLLNVSVHVLRRELGENALTSAGDDVRLDPEIVRSDVATFETAIAEGDAERAVDLYTAPFLDGFHLNGSSAFERWLDGERDRLAGLYERALESLAAEAEAAEDAEAAVEWWRRLVVHNSYSGRIAVGLMRALEAAGDHGAAIRHGCQHTALLRDELGAEPDPEVTALAERLKAEPNGPNGNGVDRAATLSGPIAPVHMTLRQAQRDSFSSPGGLRGRLALRAMLGGAVLVAAAVSVVLVWPRHSPELAGSRVLVASFENGTGDASLDHLGDMAADWIQQGLAATDLVNVVDQATALLSANHVEENGEIDRTGRVRELALEAGAGTVVSGSFYLEADSIVFLANIADANAGELLLSLDAVRSASDAPMVAINRLRGRVMGGLGALFDERLGDLTSGSSRPPTYEAYREFVEGLDGYVRRDYRTAIDHFSAAAALDTSFYLALLWRARSLGGGGWDPDQLATRDSIMKVLVAKRDRLSPLDRYAVDYHLAIERNDRPAQLQIARRAVALAPRSDWALRLANTTMLLSGPREAMALLENFDPDRGWVKGYPPYWFWLTRGYHLLGEHDRELKVALEGRKRHPADPRLFATPGAAYAALGDLEAMERLIGEYIQLPPQPPYTPAGLMGSGAQELKTHGHHEQALILIEQAVAWYKAHGPDEEGEVARRRHRWSLALSVYQLAAYQLGPPDRALLDEAQARFEELVAEMPEGSLGYLGSIAALRGDRAAAEEYSSRLPEEVRPHRRNWVPYYQARIAALLGDEGRALELLKTAAADGFSMPFWLHRDETWEAMRGKPEIQKMMRPWEEPSSADDTALVNRER